MVKEILDKTLREQFLNSDVMGCAGAILELLHEKQLPFDKWGNALKLASSWLEGKGVPHIAEKG